MKTLAALATILISSNLLAEVRTSLNTLDRLTYDGTTLEFGYSIGGGCASHVGQVELELEKVSKYENIVTVKALDVADSEDWCEAILYIDASVNLKEKIQKLAQENELSPYSMKVRLPEVSVRF